MGEGPPEQETEGVAHCIYWRLCWQLSHWRLSEVRDKL